MQDKITYSLTQNSKEFIKFRFPNLLTVNAAADIVCFLIENYMKLFKTVSVYIMTTYLCLQLLRLRYKSIKQFEKLLRRHFIISFDVFEVLG